MFTVVIPLFNKEEYIHATVASVLQQTYSDFELLVINDGSTDGSLGVLQEYKDARIKIISTKNNGAAAARNLGVSKAIHPYVALLDADDWWAPTYLEEMAKAITTFPANTVFATGRTHIFAEKEVVYTHSYLPEKGTTDLVNHFQVLSKHLPAINSSNVVVRKDYFIETGGFNEAMQHFEDHECWLRLALKQPIVFVNKPLSYYNKTAQKSSSKRGVSSSDLRTYFETMVVIKEQLSGKEKRYFRKFYQRFVKWSYLKFAPMYTEKERVLLQESMVKLVSTLEVKILEELQKTGIATIYKRAKKLSNGGS
tara:strand:+ start:890 stop:1819 length:930 start_codon:yes stop_codon:yes gene_type:complete